MMDTETKIISHVMSTGFAFAKEWNPSENTEDVAARIGTPLDIGGLLPGSGIRKLQTLKPKTRSPDLRNQYSGSYGLGDFPLHSDLAHWNIPPHYLLMRCIEGAADVLTHLLPIEILKERIDDHILMSAMVVPRRKSKSQTICPLQVAYKRDGAHGIRWDSLFLQPINEAGRKFAQLMKSTPWSAMGMYSLCLANPGDTLVIDNMKMLHGRSSVPETSQGRIVERIYLDKVGG